MPAYNPCRGGEVETGDPQNTTNESFSSQGEIPPQYTEDFMFTERDPASVYTGFHVHRKRFCLSIQEET